MSERHNADDRSPKNDPPLKARITAVSAVAVLIAAAIVLGVALESPASTPRRAFTQLVGWNLAMRMDPVPKTHLIRSRSDRSRARSGTPGGYRAAVVFTDPGATCDPNRDPLDCGAKLEVYRHHDDAASRAILLRSHGERVRIRGAFLLRGRGELPTRRWHAYVNAFIGALTHLNQLADIAATH
jgi:hypothetical protein